MHPFVGTKVLIFGEGFVADATREFLQNWCWVHFKLKFHSVRNLWVRRYEWVKYWNKIKSFCRSYMDKNRKEKEGKQQGNSGIWHEFLISVLGGSDNLSVLFSKIPKWLSCDSTWFKFQTSIRNSLELKFSLHSRIEWKWMRSRNKVEISKFKGEARRKIFKSQNTHASSAKVK
jgi:hypothetical protein